MSQPPEIAQSVLDYLNGLAAHDPYLLHAMLHMPLPCAEAIAHHPSILVEDDNYPHVPPGQFRVMPLSLLLGLVGIIPDGPLAGQYWIRPVLSAVGGVVGFELQSGG